MTLLLLHLKRVGDEIFPRRIPSLAFEGLPRQVVLGVLARLGIALQSHVPAIPIHDSTCHVEVQSCHVQKWEYSVISIGGNLSAPTLLFNSDNRVGAVL
jgi:hypothetical protein